jgi:hypothetical protein
VREVYKHSIFGNRWRDVLSVNFIDEGDEQQEATVYVCQSFEPENYECSRMFSVSAFSHFHCFSVFCLCLLCPLCPPSLSLSHSFVQINGTFDCLYNPEIQSNVVGAFDANKLAHGVAVTTGMAPTLLFFFLLLIGLPFYSCSRECENAVHFLKDDQFIPLSAHSSLSFPGSSSSSSSPSLRLKEPSSTSPHYTELNGLDLITESSSSFGFYLPYVEAALERHNTRLRDMVVQMEIESAIEPHPIASRAVDDADSYVDKMFDTSQIEETVLSVVPNDPLPVTYPWTKFLGFLALSLVVAIVAWFAASWKDKPENAGAVDILDLTKTLSSCFGVGCFFFLTTWLILLLLLMQVGGFFLHSLIRASFPSSFFTLHSSLPF